MFGAFSFSGAVFSAVPAAAAGQTDYEAFLEEVDGDDVFLVELVPYQIDTAE